MLERGGLVTVAQGREGPQLRELHVVDDGDLGALGQLVEQGRGVLAGLDEQPREEQLLAHAARAPLDALAPVGQVEPGRGGIAQEQVQAQLLEGEALREVAPYRTAAAHDPGFLERREGGLGVALREAHAGLEHAGQYGGGDLAVGSDRRRHRVDDRLRGREVPALPGHPAGRQGHRWHRPAARSAR